MAGHKVLVTGAGGFIGRWTVAPLLARGYEVHAVTRRGPPAETVGAIFHDADLLDGAAMQTLVKAVRPSHLLHMAWNATPGIYWTTPENFAWVAASLALVRSFHEAGGRRVVVAGTCAEYDWTKAGICREDETPDVLAAAAPALPYAVCKASLQKVLASYGRLEKLPIAWGRIFFQYGPYEDVRRLVPSVIVSLLKGEPALCSHGRQRRSFLHAADVGGAFAALIDSDIEGPVNIGSDEEVALADVVNIIGETIGRPELVKLGAREAPAGEPPILLPDGARLYGELGFRPQETLRSGLEKTIAWWHSQLSPGDK